MRIDILGLDVKDKGKSYANKQKTAKKDRLDPVSTSYNEWDSTDYEHNNTKDLLSGPYSHAENTDRCPACRSKMDVGYIGSESVYYCPTHNITMPMRFDQETVL